MFETKLTHELVEWAAPSSRLVLPDELIDVLGQCYQELPAFLRRRLSFERYLLYRVRNGALFEKLRHHRSRRHGRSAFRPRAGEAL